MIYAYDFEVFSNDWLVVFKNDQSENVFHNDSVGLKKWISNNKPILIGFNNYNYDDRILKYILDSYFVDPKNVYKISNQTIKNQDKKFCNLPFLTLDVRQELPFDLSLKNIEAHLGWDIVESPIAFDIDRKLTGEEIAKVTKYCSHDVDATLKIWKLREDYFSGKSNLVKEFNLPYNALKKTQASLSAEVLAAEYSYKSSNDRLLIDYDQNIDWEIIPKNIKWFFEKTRKDFCDGYNMEQLEKRWLSVFIAGVEHILGFGGLHGGRDNFVGEGNFLHIDVGSYYPTLMINNKWVSRACKNPEKFCEIRDTRFALKKAGDSREYVYKIILNSTFGATKAKYNKMFDPKMANNICVNGQIILIQLIKELLPFIILIQSNTDGIIVEIKDLEGIDLILNSFGQRFNLTFSKTKIKKIVQRDVNNYAIQTEEGKIKAKGIFALKTWKNNFLNIVPKALQNHFFHGISALETVSSADILDFQMIAKTGSKYSHIEVDGKQLQKCNRIFATRNGSTIYKVKSDGRKDKVPNTSEKSTVWNGSKFDTIDLDKKFYISLIDSELQNFK